MFACSSVATADFTALDQQVKFFNDWAVACNNQRECTVDSLPPKSDQPATTEAASTGDQAEVAAEDDSSTLYLELNRKGAADSTATLNISSWSGEDGMWLDGDKVSISVDKQVFDLGKIKTENLDEGTLSIPADKSAEILAALQKGTEGEIAVGEDKSPFKLAGFNDSLQYIDEQQQRVDTSTALVKKGDQPFSATLPGSELIKPVFLSEGATPISDEELATVSEKVRQLPLVKDCLAKQSKDESPEDLVERLDETNYLVGITCELDEYNPKILFLVAPKDKLDQAALAQFDQGADNSIVIGEVNGYDNLQSSLYSFYRKNEPGDCGSSSDWTWTGKSFVLVRYDTMPECRGFLTTMNVWKLNVDRPKIE